MVASRISREPITCGICHIAELNHQIASDPARMPKSLLDTEFIAQRQRKSDFPAARVIALKLALTVEFLLCASGHSPLKK